MNLRAGIQFYSHHGLSRRLVDQMSNYLIFVPSLAQFVLSQFYWRLYTAMRGCGHDNINIYSIHIFLMVTPLSFFCSHFSQIKSKIKKEEDIYVYREEFFHFASRLVRMWRGAWCLQGYFGIGLFLFFVDSFIHSFLGDREKSAPGPRKQPIFLSSEVTHFNTRLIYFFFAHRLRSIG